MKIALSVKNKLGFIDGTIAKPPSSDLVLNNAWIRNNNFVLSWNLNSVLKEISSSILYGDSAFDVWKDLEEHYCQSNAPRIFQLRRELMNLVQDQKPVSMYFTKLKAVREELLNFRPSCSCGKCTCGGVKELSEFIQNEYVTQFLMGLNETFTQARGLVLLMDPIPPMNNVFSMISQDEKQRFIVANVDGVADQSSTMAMAIRDDQSWRNNNKKERHICRHCKILGHAVDKCYKLHRYPPGYKSKAKGVISTFESLEDGSAPTNNLTPQQIHQIIQSLSSQLASTSAQDNANDINTTIFKTYLSNSMINAISHYNTACLWILDSGASRHICSNSAMVMNFNLFIIPVLLYPII